MPNIEDSFPTVSLPGTGSGDAFQATQIGPYKLCRMLGEGAFGYVFLAMGLALKFSECYIWDSWPYLPARTFIIRNDLTH